MKTLYETIFDTTANPEDFVVWKRSTEGNVFSGEPKEVNPIFQDLMDTIISNSKEVDKVACKKALKQNKPVMIVSRDPSIYSTNDGLHVIIYCIEQGRFTYYSIFGSGDRRQVSYIGKFTVTREDMYARFTYKLYVHHYYLISKNDLKIIQDFYNKLQKRIK